MKSGNFFLPLDPSFPLSYLLSLVKRTEVGVVLTTREEWGEVVGGEGRKRKRGEELGWVGGWEGGRVVFLDELLENHFSVLFPSPSSSPSTSPPSPPPFPPVGEDISSLVNYEPSPDSAAYLATTSGSTGLFSLLKKQQIIYISGPKLHFLLSISPIRYTKRRYWHPKGNH